MQKHTQNIGEGVYRERLTPSLWILVSAAVVAPMASLVFVPIDTTLALIAGLAVGVAVVALMIAGSPVIEVRDGILRAGRARIEVHHLADPRVDEGEDARLARGARLARDSWHLIRGGIDATVTVEVVDPDDPTPSWVMSTRTPDRLAAAIRHAQVRSTPGR